ncbi:MAG: NAD(P)-binding domain-containing protein [Bacteroidales bacterium]|nr:NAD(P)-binding domain-containing protein [Bacteroidales bacterium]
MATKLLAVTGNPILHSKSPNMFNAMFAHNGLDAEYIYIAAETAEEAMFLFKKMDIVGMNVTSPFKETIASLLDVVHDEAKILGSVNTVVNKNGILHGYNTDFCGVTQSFIDSGITVKGKKCIVIGAGGAGKAAAYGLHSQGSEVVIVNRTFSKAQDAAKIIGCGAAELKDLEQLVAESEIIISALQQNVNPIKEDWLSSKHIVFDANYKGSLLVDMARRKGCTIVSAEDWLLNQAVVSYSLFLGENPDKEVMRSGLSMPTLAQRNHIISTIGIMGAGKTSHGKLVAEKMGYKFYDIDDEIVEKEGRTITDIFAQDGEAYFRELEKNVLSEKFDSSESSVLSCGGGIVLNKPNRDLLKQNTVVVWFYATPETISQRVNIGKRPLLQKGNPTEILRTLLRDRHDLYAHTAHVVFCTEAASKVHTAERIKNEFERIWGTK